MKKRTFTLFFIILTSSLKAQSISRQVLASAGKEQNGGNSRLSWTVGEPVTGLMTKNGHQLSSGHHRLLKFEALTKEEFTMDLVIKVFPNPTSDYLFAVEKDQHQMKINMTDISGKIIMTKTFNSEEAIDISDFPKAIYLMEVQDIVTNKKNTYKIIKN